MLFTGTRLLNASILFSAALCTSGAIAQDDRWFKVELMIFSQGGDTAPLVENWDPSPALAYPESTRFLIDPEIIEANLKGSNATRVIDEYGRQTLTLDTGSSARGPGGQTAAPGTPQSANSVSSPARVGAGSMTPTPFTTLSGSEMEFLGKAAYMQRTGRYEILFHETWVQPVASENRAIPIVVDRSGDLRTWPRLQGTFKLYLSRYLHLETDLWLNTSGLYLPAAWEMPAPPLGPTSLIFNYPGTTPAQGNAYQGGYGAAKTNVATSSQPEDELIIEETGPVYPWRHAVQLKQKRRMRSTEVHYIDHPMFGVVVLVSPITDEELAAMAALEVAAQ